MTPPISASPISWTSLASQAHAPLTEESILATLVNIDLRVDEQRRLNDLAEHEMFTGSAQGDRRSMLTLCIALRDELIDELLERKFLLATAAELLAGKND